jgi:DNA modification methylase
VRGRLGDHRKGRYDVTSLDTGVLYCNDNLDRLASFPAESVDLVYLDPPFFSNRFYEVIWGDEAEVRSFEDRWAGGLNVYVNWLRQRMDELRRVLKPTGSLYLHCDWHAGHYLKVMCDEIFGYQQFQNEFVWYYSGGGASKRRWARKHDTILLYTKGREWTFNADAVRTEYKWTRGQKRADQSARDLKKGKLADDVWEHHSIMPWANERMGYPTQKPEALLERLITASSNADDVVLDPFCGCGTTVAVANRLDRRWIGIDISPTAIDVIKRRWWNASHTFPRVVDMPDTEAEFRKLGHFEFQNRVIAALNGSHNPKKTGDMGIDGYWFFTKDPIQVKQSDSAGRNVIDNFETAMRRGKYDTGYVVAFSFTKGAAEEAARARQDGLHIKLIRIKEIIMLMKRPEDALKLTVPKADGRLPGVVTELPIIVRKPDELPTTEALIRSNKAKTA